VIISNNITTYAGDPDLVNMIAERNDNANLPALFTDTISSLDKWNAAALQKKRKSFALDNTYQKQIKRIEQQISELRNQE